MESPEEAARLGRLMQQKRPDLLRSDWGSGTKLAIMRMALRAKFTAHEGPRDMLLSTLGTYHPISTRAPAGESSTTSGGRPGDDNDCIGSGSSYQVDGSSGEGIEGPAGPGDLDLVENSPHDFFWGRGFDGSGQNQLGRLLVELREELQYKQKL